MIDRSDPIVLTKKLTRSGRSLSISIPSEITALLSLDDSTVVEIALRKVVPARVRIEPATKDGLVGR
jgi:hypothetical protein